MDDEKEEFEEVWKGEGDELENKDLFMRAGAETGVENGEADDSFIRDSLESRQQECGSRSPARLTFGVDSFRGRLGVGVRICTRFGCDLRGSQGGGG